MSDPGVSGNIHGSNADHDAAHDRERLSETSPSTALGVRRLSAGSALSEATLGFVRRLASEFLIEGASDKLFTPDNLSWSGMNALFPKDGHR